MLSPAMQDALNQQITHELASSYLYLAMSAYCTTQNFDGFASWFRVQSQEENGHALKLLDLVLDRGGRVSLQAIEAPQSEFESLLNVMQQSLAHEQKVTALIGELYQVAVREADYITQAQLQWFLTEQVEEEKTVTGIVEQLRLIGGHGSGLFVLDRELAARAAPGATA